MNESVIEKEKNQEKKKRRLLPFSLASLKSEFAQVTWTSRSALILLTKVVIISTFCFGFAVYFADLSIKGVLDGLSVLFKMIFGQGA